MIVQPDSGHSTLDNHRGKMYLIDAPMSVNGSDDVLVLEFPGSGNVSMAGLLGADKTGKGHSR